MDQRGKRPYWAFLFNDFISQTDRDKLRERLEPLELELYKRSRELANENEAQAERLAIQTACEKLLEIKTQKLGFPPVPQAE
jgi:hypothetical protein